MQVGVLGRKDLDELAVGQKPEDIGGLGPVERTALQGGGRGEEMLQAAAASGALSADDFMPALHGLTEEGSAWAKPDGGVRLIAPPLATISSTRRSPDDGWQTPLPL
jgi:hypothetical protein